MPEPQTPVHWLDTAGTQQGPEPWETVQARVAHAQIPPSTQVWWDGAPGWMPFDQVEAAPAPAPAPAPTPTPTPTPDATVTLAGSAPAEPTTAEPTAATPTPAGASAAPTGASAALMSGLSDQELDDEFIGLVGRSWELYKDTEFATSIDEATLGGVITALVDCGFVLIDLETAGAAPVVTTTTTTGTAEPVVTGAGHQLRFEEPETQSRVTVQLEHLTPDVATAKIIGHRANAVIGYGQRVKEFNKVGQALRQEVQSSMIVSPEPGTVSFDADLSSGYVYAQIDLLLELDRYVSEDLSVDHDLLRRHLASVVYTMKTFVQMRFGS
ncbi:MAG TPA: hypothetical protein P5193_03840 [Microthrixaceae bacterium]|nr:hypothetical protein [Microthrixaceae bacterium]MCB9401727.1 hypothetical protein [Microthrixaceae bacterium]MCO5304546.1 DUF4339 domain-containing protein [Microthrixaceae bacterium]HMR97204.1 hypothetical protein [Microthrixaceae bacterium]HMV75530.1 hypothetical protein [Microthrixaceae bacterium]